MNSSVDESCPYCGEPRMGLFCEQCGHFYATTPPPAGSAWCAVIAPDREYFETGGADVARFSFPAASPARRVMLSGTSVRIGRRSSSRDTTPEIDLADPPVDPGVSRQHARLLAQPDGTWTVIDDGSTNGTYLNGRNGRIPVHHQIPVSHEDRIHLGVWTTITIHPLNTASPRQR